VNTKCYAKVVGGIGNQLFIVAAGYAYSKKYNKDIVIDVNACSPSQKHYCDFYKDNIFKNFEYGHAPPEIIHNIAEKRFNYDELPFFEDSVSIYGYFQSLKYFEEYKDEFISSISLPDIDMPILENNHVAFHIRRGDYLIYNTIHYVCNTEYFNTQFDNFKDYQINVFTDSPEYVSEEFKKYNFNLIKSSSDIMDLTIMSNHNNIVCSNSSFSWWASLLGKPKTKIIVPDKWFHNFQPHEDVYRPEFIKVSVL